MNTALTTFVTAQQMRDCEAQLFATGIDPDTLIIRAGMAVAQVILHRFLSQQAVLVLAGSLVITAPKCARRRRPVGSARAAGDSGLLAPAALDVWHSRATAVGVQMVADWDAVWLAQACRSHELIVDGLFRAGE
jgi:NAD(P)H-hydrate repair Nnr-like enzyme with NAD(P)H-hydrate epimerase domain